MDLQRGMRDKLDKYIDLNSSLDAKMSISGPGVYDFCCFGVDAADNLSDDRYMIFYNQTASPQNEIVYTSSGNEASFSINLNSLPMSIQKLVFTVSIDGGSTMGEIYNFTFGISQNGTEALKLSLAGADFQQEKAIIAVEVYRKDTWRINAIARGFNGGLGDLLRNYGGEEETDSNAVEQPAVNQPVVNQPQNAPKVSLEKKLETGAPQLVSLAKPIKVQLEKHNLQNTIARVGLVMDITGSMRKRYNDGTVQEIVNHVLPLAVQFDDDGELDFWYYAKEQKRMDSVNMRNYKEAVPENWKDLMKELGGVNNEPPILELVVEEYKNSRLPAYVIFVTDGGFATKTKIKKIISAASEFPIFWQFVGVGGTSYGILEELDTMEGRYVDNANFFALDDFMTVPNDELYSRLLEEFPSWLREVKSKGMI